MQLYPFGPTYDDSVIQASSVDPHSPAIVLENFTFCGQRVSQLYVSNYNVICLMTYHIAGFFEGENFHKFYESIAIRPSKYFRYKRVKNMMSKG